MNDSKLFDIILALLWAINAVVALMDVSLGVQVDALCAFCPALVCTLLYTKNIFDE